MHVHMNEQSLTCFVRSSVCVFVATTEFKRLNPRYGAGGYRKSDPVTRFHAFKGAWQSSTFLNKKTNA